jgi:hypothetical protein
MTKVLVCGGRDYQNRARVHQILNAAVERLGLDAVVQGGATGADLLAKEWATARRLQCETFHADWRGLGDAAGPIRNKRMLDEGKPDLVIAFPTPGEPNKGTNGMIKLARDAGLTVHVIDAESSMTDQYNDKGES